MTGYALAVALRVIKEIDVATHGSSPESDQAFRIVIAVLEKLTNMKSGGSQ